VGIKLLWGKRVFPLQAYAFVADVVKPEKGAGVAKREHHDRVGASGVTLGLRIHLRGPLLSVVHVRGCAGFLWLGLYAICARSSFSAQ
jgi:hypothetical protein